MGGRGHYIINKGLHTIRVLLAAEVVNPTELVKMDRYSMVKHFNNPSNFLSSTLVERLFSQLKIFLSK